MAAVVEGMVVAAVDMVVAAAMVVVADMPEGVAATRALPAVAAVAAGVTSAADRLYPVRLRRQGRARQVRAPIDLPLCTLRRITPSAERRRSMQPGTHRAMQTGR